MKLNVLLLLLFALGLSGCASLVGDKTPIEKVYYKSQSVNPPSEEQLKQIDKKPQMGTQLPFYPVINPPEVKRVWICPHITEEGNLVGGYWLYIIVKQPSWYIEEGNKSESQIRIIIPYKDTTRGKKQEER